MLRPTRARMSHCAVLLEFPWARQSLKPINNIKVPLVRSLMPHVYGYVVKAGAAE